MDNVIIPLDEFRQMPNYSCTLPTGTTTGKRWRRSADYFKQEDDDFWFQGEYGEVDEASNSISIKWKRIWVDGAAIRYRMFFRRMYDQKDSRC